MTTEAADSTSRETLIRSQAQARLKGCQLLFWLLGQLGWLNSISQCCTSYLLIELHGASERTCGTTVEGIKTMHVTF
jgi:hypothetical protein